MTTQTLTLDQCPASVQAYFLAMPAFQNAMRITKSATTGTDKTQAVKTLKTSRIIPREEMVLKAANTGGFASILSGSVARNIGTPAPAIPKTPAPTTAPTDAVLARANTGLTTRGANTPKEPTSTLAASRGNVVEYKDLQTALNAAMAAQHIQRQHEAFNEKRSAFSRIAPTKKSDVQGGGSGNAFGLRNLGGRLAASVLNGTTRKGEGGPVGSSALDVAFGRR